jgi:hypothetical protein
MKKLRNHKTMKQITILATAVATLMLVTTVSHAQAPAPLKGTPDTISHVLLLLSNEENTIYDIIFDGPGKGSPEHRAASDRYCALQAFIRLAVHYEKDGRYKVMDNPDTDTKAIVDTETGKTMLESRDGRLISYDKELDAKTFTIDD